MFKYIYVFILIVILFGIKWKLKKKYEFKEEFIEADTLTDMFSSSDGATPHTFYDKLYRINSNIKFDFDSNLSWNLGTSQTIWFQHDTDPYSRIEIHPDAQGIGFGDSNNSIHDKVLTSVDQDKLSFELQRVSLPEGTSPQLWNSNFANFDINSNSTFNINESVSNLKSWHIPNPTGWYWEPFGVLRTPDNPLYAYNSRKTVGQCQSLCDTDHRCVGFEIENTTRGYGDCVRFGNSITLDTTRTDHSTYFKPVT